MKELYKRTKNITCFVDRLPLALQFSLRGRVKGKLKIFGIIKPENVDTFTLATPRATLETEPSILKTAVTSKQVKK